MEIKNDLDTISIPSDDGGVVSKANYSDLDSEIIADLDNITEKIVNPDQEPVVQKQDLYDNYHNYYINFFIYLQEFLNYNLIGGFNSRDNSKLKIKDFYLNYASKTVTSFSSQKSETKVLPYATITILDIKPVNNIDSISKQILTDNSINRIMLCSNETKKEAVSVSIVQNTVNVSIEINFQDATEVIDYMNIIYNNIPLNFSVYTEKYKNLINITPLGLDWDFDTDIIYNAIIKPNNTWTNQEYLYSIYNSEPVVELNSIQPSIDKDEMRYTLTLDFIFLFYQPVNLYKHSLYNINNIDLKINIESNVGLIENYPLIESITKTTDTELLEIINKKIVSQIPINDNIFLLNKAEYIFPCLILPGTIINDDIINNFDLSLWYKKIHNISGESEIYYSINFLKNVGLIELNLEMDLTNFDIDNIKEIIIDNIEIGDKNKLYKLNISDESNTAKYNYYCFITDYLLADANILENYSCNLLTIK